MVRFGSLLLWVIVMALATQSCNKSGNEDCPFLAPKMIYVGFTEDESDTMVIRRFEKNSNFLKLLDTVTITRAHIQRIEVGKDSMRLEPDNYPNLNAGFYLNDWQIYFPAANRTVSVTDATPQFTQEKEPSAQCQSYVSSVIFDGNYYNFTSWFDVPYRVYATK